VKYCTFLVLLAMALPCRASAYDTALRTAMQAAVKQSEVDKMVEEYVKRKVPEPLIVFVSNWSVVGKVVVEKKLEVKWTF
jgi:hypothetical protein